MRFQQSGPLVAVVAAMLATAPLGALLILPPTLPAQASAPTLTLGAPRFTTGELELDRVRGAGLLPDGRLAIANGGSFQVLLVNRRGTIEKRFGREGEGPGDFGGLNGLWTFGDTIATWDGLLGRVTLWRTDGTVIRTFGMNPLPGQQGATWIEALASPTKYLASTHGAPAPGPNGAYLDEVSLFAMDGTRQTDLGRHPWSYTFLYTEGPGSSGFATPFLGQTIVAAAANKVLILEIGENRVDMRRPDGTRGSVALPITPPTGRDRAKVYGDSLIAAQRNPDPRWVRRVSTVLGPDFPVVERQAVAQRAVTVGSTVWFQEFQQPKSSTTTWWIVDARREALVGRVALPATALVLGGSDTQVLLRLVDEDGVQSVGVFGFPGR